MTAISMTVKQYFLRKGDEKSNRILMFIPYNFREKPKDRQDFTFNNQISVLPVILDLVLEFKTGVQHISRSLRPIRDSFMTLAMYYLVNLIFYLPFKLSFGSINLFADRTSILTTNVRGPPVSYHLDGVESIKCTTFMPNLCDIPGGFAIVSHQDIMWVSFNSDVNRCDDAKEVISIFEEVMDKILES